MHEVVEPNHANETFSIKSDAEVVCWVSSHTESTERRVLVCDINFPWNTQHGRCISAAVQGTWQRGIDGINTTRNCFKQYEGEWRGGWDIYLKQKLLFWPLRSRRRGGRGGKGGEGEEEEEGEEQKEEKVEEEEKGQCICSCRIFLCKFCTVVDEFVLVTSVNLTKLIISLVVFRAALVIETAERLLFHVITPKPNASSPGQSNL